MALMRGDALMSLSDIGPATGPLQDGRVRALAVTSPQRLPSYPDVPTMAEAGFKDMEVEFWTGLLAPAKTPARDRAAAGRGHGDREAARRGREVRRTRSTRRHHVGGIRQVIARELVQWGDVAKKGNIKIQ